MIPLAVPAQTVETGGGGSLPAGAVAQLDFINEFYYAGGSEQAISSLLGGGFDAGEISASGMLIDFENSNRPNAAGSWFTDITTTIATGITILFEIDYPDTPFGSFIHILNDVDYNTASKWASSYVGGVAAPYVEANNGISFDGTSNSLTSTGMHKIAMTFYRNLGGGTYQFAVSVDGGAATTDTTTTAPFSPYTKITIGHDGGGGLIMDAGYIRAITIYPAMNTTDLALLSAP